MLRVVLIGGILSAALARCALDAGVFGDAACVATFMLAPAIAWALQRHAAVPALDGSDGAEEGELASGPMLRALLDACRDAVLTTDLQARVVHANRAAREIFGEGVRPGISIADSGILAQRISDRDAFEDALERLYAHPEQGGTGEVTCLGAGLHIFGWLSEPIRDASGVAVGRSFVLTDRSLERELSTLKGDFLSTVTHELRTPLTSVKGSLQLVLGKSAALSAIDRELLTISLKNADRLIRLINDLLDISRLEFGKVELAFGAVAVPSLVEEAVVGLRSYAEGREVEVECDVGPDLPPLEGDRDRLIQVLTNLISNAVKFSPADGRVEVRARQVGDGVAIAVRDRGRGIPACEQERLFQRFQRLHRGRDEEPGTGLGLAISKAIIDRHGGRIEVESQEGQGSTFTVVIPAREQPRPRVASSEEGHAPAPRATVLLVLDDLELGSTLDGLVRGRYRLLRVERGVQALHVARAEHPDLIVLEDSLPDLSGDDVLRMLRQTAAARTIPVIMLRAGPENGSGHIWDAPTLLKPVDGEALRRTIDAVLARGPRHVGICRRGGPEHGGMA